MRVRYVTAIDNLKISSPLGRGEKLDETMRITNDHSTIQGLVMPAVMPIMGSLEWCAIKNSNVVIYSTDEIGKQTDPREFLKRRLFQTKGCFHALWLVLDNAADNELGFAIYDPGSNPTVSSNFITTAISKADGTAEITEISRDQLRAARQLYRKFEYDDPTAEYITRLEKTADRVARAFYHVQAARTTRDLGLKIVNYCTAIESLFASSQGELTHQLSERLAFFLGESGQSRMRIYKAFKRAYSFRSRITHGAAISSGQLAELKELSLACDEYLRKSLRRLIEDSDLRKTFASDGNVDEYFVTMILRNDRVNRGDGGPANGRNRRLSDFPSAAASGCSHHQSRPSNAVIEELAGVFRRSPICQFGRRFSSRLFPPVVDLPMPILRTGPDVAAARADREENHDPGGRRKQ